VEMEIKKPGSPLIGPGFRGVMRSVESSQQIFLPPETSPCAAINIKLPPDGVNARQPTIFPSSNHSHSTISRYFWPYNRGNYGVILIKLVSTSKMVF
jgi:hypothetical protein